MMVAEVMGLRYHRIILESVNSNDTAKLKSDFDYSFIVCMGEFEDPDYEIVEKKSCIIDLGQGLDSIVESFSATSRNEYRRSDRTEGLVFFNGYKDFDLHYQFYSECERERSWFSVPPDELKNSFLFTATYNSYPISGMSCFAHGRRLRVGRIFSSKRSGREKFPQLNNTLYGSAAKRIVVEICKFGIEQGYETADLGGVDLTEQNKSGITQFKLSLGGKVVDVRLGRFMKERFRKKLDEIKSKGWDIT